MTTQTIKGAYAAEAEQITELLEVITRAHQQRNMKLGRGGVTWGHVGDAITIREKLAEVADQITNRGEYAPENAAR